MGALQGPFHIRGFAKPLYKKELYQESVRGFVRPLEDFMKLLYIGDPQNPYK